MTAYEIVAILGAFAWLPPIITVIRRWILTPKVRLIAQRTVEIGFTNYGPIANLHVAFSVSGRDVVVSNIKMKIIHESGEQRVFTWQGIVQHIGRLSNPGTAQVPYDKEQSVLAMKLHVNDIEERFIRFQEDEFIAGKYPIEEKAIKHLLYLRESGQFEASKFLSSEQMTDLYKYMGQSFNWKKGKYTVVFEMSSPERFRLLDNVYHFELTTIDIEALEKNKETIDKEYENEVSTGPDGSAPNAIQWNWRYPNFSGT